MAYELDCRRMFGHLMGHLDDSSKFADKMDLTATLWKQHYGEGKCVEHCVHTSANCCDSHGGCCCD